MALTDFVDQLSAPGASPFSALTSSSFPSLTDFSASTTSEALKCTDLGQNTVYQVVSTRTVNTRRGQSVFLSLRKADGSFCSVWACGMPTKELLLLYDDGELTVICVVNWTENEQDWKSVQFVSTATVLIICKIFLLRAARVEKGS